MSDSFSVLPCLLFLCPDYSPQFGDCWPLGSKRQAVIRRNKRKLVRYLYINDELIDELSKRECFTYEKLQNIRKKATMEERNEALLDHLMKSSIGNFQLVLDCLRITQPHLIPLLTGDTGMNLMKSSRWS